MNLNNVTVGGKKLSSLERLRIAERRLQIAREFSKQFRAQMEKAPEGQSVTMDSFKMVLDSFDKVLG